MEELIKNLFRPPGVEREEPPEEEQEEQPEGEISKLLKSITATMTGFGEGIEGKL